VRQTQPRLGRPRLNYERSLRSIGEHVGNLITGVTQGKNWLETIPTLRQLLEAYAEALKPWATATAHRMLMDIDAQDRKAWLSLGSAISTQLRQDILRAPVGERLRELLAEEVSLIRSIPTDAALRVHELSIKALENSGRYRELTEEVMRSGEVAKSRATLIARTETSRTATALTQVRAEAAGSTHYVWETSRDSSVRPGHKVMQGKVCAWDDPPAVDEGDGHIMHHHPGSIWNCRCWARPIVDLS